MQVDRCICGGVSFVGLLRLAREQGLSLEQLAARTGCTKGCGLCEPYVRLALATGKASFPVMHPLTIERMILDLEEGRNEAEQGSS